MDPALGLVHLRARFMNPESGRFLTRDPYQGAPEDPASLHRYTYVANDPLNRFDPTGLLITEYVIWGREVHRKLGLHFRASGPRRDFDRSINEIIQRVGGAPVPWGLDGLKRPDLVDFVHFELYEIKPFLLMPAGYVQL